MKRLAALAIIFVLGAVPGLGLAGEPIHHALRVVVQPKQNQIQIFDTITLPESWLPKPGQRFSFVLHSGLNAASASSGVTITKTKEPAGALSPHSPVRLDRYHVALPAGRKVFVVRYQGKIHHPLQSGVGGGAGTAEQSPGLISSDGVVLSGETAWYPRFDNELVTFRLEVHLPPTWDAVSQGRRTLHDKEGGLRRVRWEIDKAQDEIFLIAGKFTEYSRPAGDVTAQAFFRTPDDALAKSYLDATVDYLAMYSTLIGPYPYSKFALVENSWETGFGMPSFTLLGPSVIRLPFILHTSYPHEILHNWWGNGVFVETATGNWSEGLTAYLADHLTAEQRGGGADYRRAALQKYADYVSADRDFPLTEFVARHSGATEAVGYGKTLMFFHMLRLRLGDEIFIRALRKFYEDYRFKRAAWADLEVAFSATAGENLSAEFDQWVRRAGAPALRLREVAAAKVRSGPNTHRVTAVLEQTQEGLPFRLRVPVAIHVAGVPGATQSVVTMNDRQVTIDLQVSGEPTRIEIDPEFDLFRRLDRNEIPPALSQSLGAEKGLILLPSEESGDRREAYRRLALALAEASAAPHEIKLDSEVGEIPSDRAVWILGWKNRFLPAFKKALSPTGVSLDENGVRIGESQIIRAQHSVAITARSPANKDAAMTWIAAGPTDAMGPLARKLPHYGRFGYAAFEGSGATNILKGQLPVADSPLSVEIAVRKGKPTSAARGALAPRQPLIPAASAAARHESR